jgi:hypothetical protein
MPQNHQSSIDYHTNQWLMLQYRLDKNLYSSLKEKSDLQEQQHYHANELVKVPDDELVDSLSVITTPNKIPPS